MTIFRCIFISKQQALDTGYTYTEYIRTVSGSSPPNHRKGKLLSKREEFFCDTIPFWISYLPVQVDYSKKGSPHLHFCFQKYTFSLLYIILKIIFAYNLCVCIYLFK